MLTRPAASTTRGTMSDTRCDALCWCKAATTNPTTGHRSSKAAGLTGYTRAARAALAAPLQGPGAQRRPPAASGPSPAWTTQAPCCAAKRGILKQAQGESRAKSRFEHACDMSPPNQGGKGRRHGPGAQHNGCAEAWLARSPDQQITEPRCHPPCPRPAPPHPPPRR